MTYETYIKNQSISNMRALLY